MKKILLILAMMMAANSASAVVTGNDLEDNSYNKFGIAGYIVGVTDVLTDKGAVCFPEGTKGIQILAVVDKFFDNNPKKWNLPAESLITSALMEAYPCKKQLHSKKHS